MGTIGTTNPGPGAGWSPNVNLRALFDGTTVGDIQCYIPWDAYAGSHIDNKIEISCPVGLSAAHQLTAGTHIVQIQVQVQDTSADTSITINSTGEGDGYDDVEVYAY